MRQRTLVLAYHNIWPDGTPLSGEHSLHLSRSEFARQLDHLAKSHDVVSIEHFLQRANDNDRPRVVITFDDAYEGALTAGIDELIAREMPATIFVSPGLLDTVTWWDVLAERWGGEIPQNVRLRALHEQGGKGETILADHQSSRSEERSISSLPKIGSESQLSRAGARPGISIGSHTWSHPNLCALDDPGLETELTRSLQWLRARFPRTVSWISYPYGLFDSRVEGAASRTGYEGAFRIDGGWISGLPSRLGAVPRLNIPSGLSVDGFRLRLAGL